MSKSSIESNSLLLPVPSAQQQNGSTIVLEHRFYGLSNPYPNLSVSSLKFHTIQQAVDDLVYFAQNVNLPMPGGDSVAPNEAPWVLVGGSYSGKVLFLHGALFFFDRSYAGALTSWTMVKCVASAFFLHASG